MNTALWIIQILLSVMMLVLGFMKTFYPVEKLHKFSWTNRRPKAFVRFVGISEMLIGIGLILPEVTGILPALTSYAALSLCMIMVLAMAEHIRYKEAHEIWKNAIIILIGAFVAIGRLAA
ncbi:MAG TPA: DoxX family protein [Chitinophagaceae bacterium]